MTGDSALLVAVKLIAEFEGFRATPYQDEGGDWAIGYGFSVTADGQHVNGSTPPVTQEDAYQRLVMMVWQVLQRVRGLLHVKANLTPNQVAALVSLAFNIGTGAFGGSTLLALLNAGEMAAAALHFGAYVYDPKGFSRGLQARRAAEQKLFEADIPPARPVILPKHAVDPDNEADALNLAELQRLNPTTPEG